MNKIGRVLSLILIIMGVLLLASCGSSADSDAEITTQADKMSAIDIYTAIVEDNEENSDFNITMTEKARKFITEHDEYFPSKDGVPEELIDKTIDARHINKNCEKYGDTFIELPMLGVRQIFETEIQEDDYFTEINAYDENGQQYYVFYNDELNDVFEDSIIHVVGIPMGTGAFQNTDGGDTLVIYIAAASVECLDGDADNTNVAENEKEMMERKENTSASLYADNDIANAIEGDARTWAETHLYRYGTTEIGDRYQDLYEDEYSEAANTQLIVSTDNKVMYAYIGSNSPYVLYGASANELTGDTLMTTEFRYDESKSAKLGTEFVDTYTNEDGTAQIVRYLSVNPDTEEFDACAEYSVSSIYEETGNNEYIFPDELQGYGPFNTYDASIVGNDDDVYWIDATVYIGEGNPDFDNLEIYKGTLPLSRNATVHWIEDDAVDITVDEWIEKSPSGKMNSIVFDGNGRIMEFMDGYYD